MAHQNNTSYCEKESFYHKQKPKIKFKNRLKLVFALGYDVPVGRTNIVDGPNAARG